MKKAKITLSTVGLLIFLSAANAIRAVEPAGIMLFSESDADALRLTDEDIGILSAQSKAFSQGGPEIQWIYPELDAEAGSSADTRVEFTSPSSLTIEFKKTLAAIDYDSLDVRGKKFGFSKSVTDLVKPYLHGNVLAAENIELPKGKFLVEVAIRDVEDRETVRKFFVHSR